MRPYNSTCSASPTAVGLLNPTFFQTMVYPLNVGGACA